MKDLALIVLSCIIVYMVVYPLIEWICETKEKMEDFKDEQDK